MARASSGHAGRAPCRASFSAEADQLGVALREALAADPDIVLEPGPHAFGFLCQGPFHHLGLVAHDPGCSPGRLRRA